MKTYKMILINILFAAAALIAGGCDSLEGDNSDFDFENSAKAEDPARLPDTYRLATYNTHRCSPAKTNNANYDNTARAISLIDADVIALQELDRNTRVFPADQIGELAKRTGLHPVFCKTINYSGGEYGIGMLCRKEPIRTDSEELPGVETRRFLVAEFDDFVYICTHLCVASEDNRSWSFDIINEYVDNHYASSSKPVFIAGDMNTSVLPAGASTHWKVISASTPTFPSKSTRIDYILAYTGNSAPYTVERTFVPVYPDFRIADVSDHLPVIVDLKK